jgi:hypothetical protein
MVAMMYDMFGDGLLLIYYTKPPYQATIVQTLHALAEALPIPYVYLTADTANTGTQTLDKC